MNVLLTMVDALSCVLINLETTVVNVKKVFMPKTPSKYMA